MQIKDLSKELAAGEMATVQGGAFDRGNSDVSNIGQLAAVNAPNMVMTGPGSSLTNSNNVDFSQYAAQSVRQTNGDALIALFPYYGPIRF